MSTWQNTAHSDRESVGYSLSQRDTQAARLKLGSYAEVSLSFKDRASVSPSVSRPATRLNISPPLSSITRSSRPYISVGYSKSGSKMS